MSYLICIYIGIMVQPLDLKTREVIPVALFTIENTIKILLMISVF